MRKSRPVDMQKHVERLQRKHLELKERVTELDSRLHLSTAEDVERQRLKKEKLAAKDALLQLGRVS